MVCVIVFLVAVVFVVAVSVRIEHIDVTGCVYQSKDDVIIRSNLMYGMNMFLINYEKVKTHINSDPYFVFRDMKYDYYKRTVYLDIYERLPMCVINTLGVQCTLDVMGVVLGKTEDISNPNQLIELMGLRTRDVAVGQTINADNKQQLIAYLLMAYEINALGCSSILTQMNVLEPANLYIELANGMSVRLGNAEHMHAKILSLLTVLDTLSNMGLTGGMIDVSNPVFPVYIP